TLHRRPRSPLPPGASCQLPSFVGCGRGAPLDNFPLPKRLQR
ncbi:endonuclease/exonuclease/phosphatase family protein, partial [Toxoplasma gondii p89]